MTEPEIEREKIYDKIISAIAINPGQTTHRISQITGIPIKKCAQHLAELNRAGHLTPVPVMAWKLNARVSKKKPVLKRNLYVVKSKNPQTDEEHKKWLEMVTEKQAERAAILKARARV